MKNILIAVFLLGFLGISEGVFAQNLRLLDKELPCTSQNYSRYKYYKLYLEAKAPDPVNGLNYQTISIFSHGSDITPTVGVSGIGGFSGEKVPFSASPTGWAFCITARIGSLDYIHGHHTPPSFVIEEYDPSSGLKRQRTIKLKWRQSPAPIVDLEVIESDFCTGVIKLRAVTNSSVDGFEYSHDKYEWSFNGALYVSKLNNNVDKSTVEIHTGGPINSNFNISVVVKNPYGGPVATASTCSQTSYTKAFTIPTTVPATFFDRRSTDPKYCDKTKNEFYITNPTPGVEYIWAFDATPNQYDITLSGVDMTSFSPDFGTLPNVTGPGGVSTYLLTVTYRIGCGTPVPVTPANVISTAPFNVPPFTSPPFNHTTIVSNVPYRNCYGGSSGKIATGQNQSNKLTELTDNANILTAYPNPTTGLLELRSEGEAIEVVHVYNVTGVLVAKKLNVESSNTAINLSSLPKGMYMVNIQTATSNKTIQVAKQ